MKRVNIHTAKTHLSKIVDQAAAGEPFIIVKAGKEMVKVVPLDAPTGKRVRRIGFLNGQTSAPDDFNTMGSPQVRRMFGDEDDVI